jgi:hypothetical protein
MRNGWEYFCAIARGWTLRDARLLSRNRANESP